MYGILKNQVAINNVLPAFGGGQLKLTTTPGAGRQPRPALRVRPRHAARVHLELGGDLDFKRPPEFSNLGTGPTLQTRGLLNASVDLGIKVPQEVMGAFSPSQRSLGGAGKRGLAAMVEVRPGAARRRRCVESDQPHDQPELRGHLARRLGRAVQLSDPWRSTSASPTTLGSRTARTSRRRCRRTRPGDSASAASTRRARRSAGGRGRVPYGGRSTRTCRAGAGRARRARQPGRLVQQHAHRVPRRHTSTGSSREHQHRAPSIRSLAQ